MARRCRSGRALGASLRFRNISNRRPLAFEPLEERRLLAITVDTAGDFVNPGDSVTSLREAITLANNTAGPDTIVFDPVVFATPQAMLLLLGEMAITGELTIEGPGHQLLTIDAQQNSRIFNITAATGDFAISGLTLSGGRTTATMSAGAGGAIRSLTSGNLTIDQSIVSGNTTTGSRAGGGGISAGGNLTLIDSTVSGNTAAGNDADGGGIVAGGNVSLTQSTVSGNQATGNNALGGGIAAGGDVTMIRSTLSGNSTGPNGASGGGIFAGGHVSITQSTVSGNSTAGAGAHGGGIYSFFNVTVHHSTIAANHTDGLMSTGGGIWNESGTIDILGSIVAGNVASGAINDIVPGTGSLNVNSSLIQQNGLPLIGFGNIEGMAAGLLPLADNGGTTFTHALLASSPAIDAGPSMAMPPVVDQRGAPFVRVFDGDGVGGAQMDIGAYERQTVAASALVVDTLVDELDGDYSPGDVSLREAINAANGSLGVDTVTFDATLFNSPQEISLTLGEIVIVEGITINGPGAQLLTVDAEQVSRIFNFTAVTGDFSIAGMTIVGGRTTGDNVGASSTYSGGAIRSLTSGSLAINRSIIRDNRTVGLGADGGAIFANGAVAIAQSNFNSNVTVGNSAPGGALAAGGTVTVTESTFDENATGEDGSPGGAIRSAGSIMLSQSTISGNFTFGVGSTGGGISSLGAITLSHSTVTGNRTYLANSAGGGIWNDNDAVVITGSIVAGNVAASGNPDLRPGTGLLNVAYSLIGDNFGTVLIEAQVADASGNLIGSNGGSGIINPQLAPLADNGGPTQTHLPTSASPVINAGDPDAVAGEGGVPEFDQRGDGFGRVVSIIDIGAVEASLQLPGDYNQNGIVDAADYTVWRDTLGSTMDLRADGSGPTEGVPDGVVDAFDYAFWKANFGNVYVQGTGSGEQGAVAGELRLAGTSDEQEPEPVAAASAVQFVAATDVASFVTPTENRRGVARRLLERHTGELRDVQAEALLVWLASRRHDVVHDDETVCRLGDTEAAADDDSPIALDAVFDLLSSAG